jgi:hypothetical protein
MYRVESIDGKGQWTVDRELKTLSAALIVASSFYDWYMTTPVDKLRDHETRIVCPDGKII